MSAVPPAAPGNGGRLGIAARILDSLKTLTVTNVLVILLLGLGLGPAYLAWKIINDDDLLRMIFSNYEERRLPGTDCALRVASVRTARPTYFISLSYAYSGNDRWYIGVNTPAEPNEVDARNYCRVLGEIIAHARDPSSPGPTFPYSKRFVFPHLPEEIPQ